MPHAHYMNEALLDWTVGRTGLFTQETHYLRAWTVLPALDGTGGTEVTGGSYAAVTIVPATHFNTAANEFSISNDGVISFPTATASWGTVVGTTIGDATSGGNIIRVITAATPRAVVSGQTLSYPIGNLILTQY